MNERETHLEPIWRDPSWVGRAPTLEGVGEAAPGAVACPAGKAASLHYVRSGALSGSSDRSWVPDLSSYRCPKRASERFDLWSKCDGTPSLAGVLGLIDLEVGVVGPSSRWLMANA